MAEEVLFTSPSPGFNTVNQEPGKLNLALLRGKVKNYIEKHHYDSAMFWADKLVTLTNENVEDVYWYAQTLYLTGQYHRASHLLRSRKLDQSYSACRYLAAKCHYECKDYQEALDILDGADNEWEELYNDTSQVQSNLNESYEDLDANFPVKDMENSLLLLRGKVYEAMDNRSLAIECYQEALLHDVYCYEALDLLVNHHMLTAEEEIELMESLPFTVQCPEEEIELVKFLYEDRLKKYNGPVKTAIPTNVTGLDKNLDTVVNKAERHYYNCNFSECYRLTLEVLSQDPYNLKCLPLHVAVLTELKKINALFYLAHKLVEFYPNRPISWFAVGCYYLLNEMSNPARIYLSKATTLDKAYGPAWLAYGHSFAAKSEHDQAMAAYFTASQIMRGCHLPALYIGLEYGLTNNAKLAEKFFNEALSIAPNDPFVLHEMGVIAFQSQNYSEAEKSFLAALELVKKVDEKIIPDKWEPLISNLGHVSRKLKKYDVALDYHRKAQCINPNNPSIYSDIGFVYALKGDNYKAVDYFHKALGIRRDDAFSTTMLSNVMEALMLETVPNLGDDDEVPEFPPPTPKFITPAPTTKLDVFSDTMSPVPPADTTSQSTDLNNSDMAIEEIEMDSSN
ncbi:cell division cycle protein 16 homolog [Patella vulgata]|uniref:cell division cycle protein 16 homolog n=1 Tax=Patella vulgata TaxID=6465 RepID=UPI00217F86F1|nr:cell division cycle protein 16 homolog [Patella vulgata]